MKKDEGKEGAVLIDINLIFYILSVYPQ